MLAKMIHGVTPSFDGGATVITGDSVCSCMAIILVLHDDRTSMRKPTLSRFSMRRDLYPLQITQRALNFLHAVVAVHRCVNRKDRSLGPIGVP